MNGKAFYLIGLLLVASSQSRADHVCGDVTGDDQINILDIVQLAGVILGNITVEPEAICRADVNADAELNVLDIVTIAQWILGDQLEDLPCNLTCADNPDGGHDHDGHDHDGGAGHGEGTCMQLVHTHHGLFDTPTDCENPDHWVRLHVHPSASFGSLENLSIGLFFRIWDNAVTEDRSFTDTGIFGYQGVMAGTHELLVDVDGTPVTDHFEDIPLLVIGTDEMPTSHEKKITIRYRSLTPNGPALNEGDQDPVNEYPEEEAICTYSPEEGDPHGHALLRIIIEDFQPPLTTCLFPVPMNLGVTLGDDAEICADKEELLGEPWAVEQLSIEINGSVVEDCCALESFTDCDGVTFLPVWNYLCEVCGDEYDICHDGQMNVPPAEGYDCGLNSGCQSSKPNLNCAQFQYDCGDCPTPVCGDASCTADETCANCPDDCGSCE